jgi:hypothetical protein
MGAVQRQMGTPRSPQNHSGILKVETFNNRKVHLVYEIGIHGGMIEPLTPADAALYQQMTGQASGTTFVGEANVGSVEVYRPFGTLASSPSANVAGALGRTGRSYPIGTVAAQRAVALKGKTKENYDFAFLESSLLADKDQFENSMYCHEFTRECFGRGLAKPVEIPVLKSFWEAALACDQEAARQRLAGRYPGDAADLLKQLSKIDISDIRFDKDPATNARVQSAVRQLIDSLSKVLDGHSFQQLTTEFVANGVREEITKEVAGQASSLAMSVLKIPSETAPMVGIFFDFALRSWLDVNSVAPIAKYLVEGGSLEKGLLRDLADAIDAEALLAGGVATGANGERVYVRFQRISR